MQAPVLQALALQKRRGAQPTSGGDPWECLVSFKWIQIDWMRPPTYGATVTRAGRDLMRCEPAGYAVPRPNV